MNLQNKISQKRQDALAIILLFGICILFFYPVVFTNDTFIARDFLRYYFPTRYFASCWMKQGIIPLWDPYLFCGIPFLANLKSAIFYPLSIIYYIFPFYIGFKIFIMIHFFLSSLFTYLLMRDLKLHLSACLLSAIIYGFNPSFMSVDIVAFTCVITWFPLGFLLLNRLLISQTKFWYLVGLGLVLGMQYLCGSPDTFGMGLIGYFLFAIAKSLFLFKEQGLLIKFKTFGFFLISGLIAIGLTLFELIPFLEMLFYSSRAKPMIYNQAVAWSLNPVDILTLFIPLTKWGNLWFGQGMLRSCYMGILSIVLILIAFLYTKGRLALFWKLLFLGYIVIALGNYLPVYPFLYNYLPGLSLMQHPVKLFSLCVLSGAVLAGLAFNQLLEDIKRYHLIIFSIFGLFFLSLLLFILVLPDKTIILFLSDYCGAIHNLIKQWYLENLILFISSCTFLLIGTILFFLVYYGFINKGVLAICIVSFVLFDLFLVSYSNRMFLDQQLYYEQSAPLKFLKKDTSFYRFIHNLSLLQAYSQTKATLRYDEFIKEVIHVLTPNISLFYQLFNADGYDGFKIKDYYTFLTLSRIGQFNNAIRLLSMANVKYILSDEEIPEIVRLVYKDNLLKIYQIPDCLDRAFFVPNAIVVKDREKILKHLIHPDFDPTKDVILEEVAPIKTQIDSNKAYSRVQIKEYQPNKVKINASCNQTGFLFLSDTYYPGWKAYVDAKETKIYRANYTFRAIVLPAGQHQIEFVYSPWSFKFGVLGSLLTLIILIGVRIYQRIKNKG